MSTKKMEGKNDKENEPSQNRSLHLFTLANLYLAFLLIQEVAINLLKISQTPPYARESPRLLSLDDSGHSSSMRVMSTAMLRLHQTDDIEEGLEKVSVKGEPPFGWFKHIKGGMRRRNVNVDIWANRVLADCLQRRRRGSPPSRVFSSSKAMFRCLARTSWRKWCREWAECEFSQEYWNYAELSRAVTF